jgi:hypothetical protein
MKMRNPCMICLAIIACLSILGCATRRYIEQCNVDQGTSNITGHVYDQDGNPAIGAGVILYYNHMQYRLNKKPAYAASTDYEGLFKIENIKPCTKYCLIIDSSGYSPLIIPTFAVKPSKTYDVCFTISEIGDPLYVHLSRPSSPPNQALQRTRTASAVHDYLCSISTVVPASAEGKR